MSHSPATVDGDGRQGASGGPGPPPGTARRSRRHREVPRTAYPVLLLLGIADSAAYGVIGPVLPTLGLVASASNIALTLLAATFPLAMLAGFALSGRLVYLERIRLAMFVGLTGLLVGSLAFVATDALLLLFAARAVMGLGSGCLWIAVTFYTIQYWPGQEYLCMSRIYAAYSIGALVGPALGALGGVRAPFAAYAMLVLICVLLARLLPTPRGPALSRDRTALRSSGFWFASVAIMFAVIGTGLLDGVLPLHFGPVLSQAQIGLAYVATAVLIAAASVLAGAVRPAAALFAGGLALCVGIALAGATADVAAWMVALALTGLGVGAAQTAATGLLLAAVSTERIVTAMVVWSQVGILGYFIAPAVGGPLTAWLGFGWLGLLPISMGAVLAAMSSRIYLAGMVRGGSR